MITVEFFDRRALALAEETIVHEDTRELLADGLVQQRSGHRGIDAARETEEHAALADLITDRGDGLRDKILGGPILFRAADADEKVADHFAAALGVKHFRVKLDAVEPAPLVLDTRIRRIFGNCSCDEARRKFFQFVAVGIPDAQLLREPGEEFTGPLDGELTVAVFARLAVRHVAAEVVPHELHPVADTEHGDAEGKNLRIRVGRRFRVNALRTAREDDADHAVLAELRRRGRVVIDLRVDLALADAARDDLRELRAKVEDSDDLWHVCGGRDVTAAKNEP